MKKIRKNMPIIIYQTPQLTIYMYIKSYKPSRYCIQINLNCYRLFFFFTLHITNAISSKVSQNLFVSRINFD